MASPLVTVVIPVFNGEPFIREAVDSVLAQTHDNLELYVLDNCSTDRTPEYLASYQDCRIRVIRNETNIGFMGNWNKALRSGSGKYLKILPADDLLAPNCIASQVAIFERETGLALVSCARQIIDDQGKVLMRRPFFPATRRQSRRQILGACARAGTNLIGEPGAVLLRRDLIEKVGNFQDQLLYFIDLNMWARVLEHGDYFQQEAQLASFRVSPISTSVHMARQQSSQALEFFRDLHQTAPHIVTRADLLMTQISARGNALARMAIYTLIGKP